MVNCIIFVWKNLTKLSVKSLSTNCLSIVFKLVFGYQTCETLLYNIVKMPLKTLKIMSKEKDHLRSNSMSQIPEERSDQVRKQLLKTVKYRKRYLRQQNFPIVH